MNRDEANLGQEEIWEAFVFDRLCHITSSWLEKTAGLVLVFIMLLIGCDIVGRLLRTPIPGAFEVVTFAGGLIIGLLLPMSLRMKEQVRIEAVTERLPPSIRLALDATTRFIIVLFMIGVSYAFFQMGNNLRESGEMSPVLHLPFYCVAYAMVVAFIVAPMILVEQLLTMLLRMWRPRND
jgi:TRAP-type C4-dicarboxylate transport system permease small subunit